MYAKLKVDSYLTVVYDEDGVEEHAFLSSNIRDIKFKAGTVFDGCTIEEEYPTIFYCRVDDYASIFIPVEKLKIISEKEFIFSRLVGD